MERPRFYALPADIMERQDLSPSAKLVVMSLAHHAWGPKTEVWPSVSHIGRSVGIRSRTTVQTAIKELQGAGLVITVAARHDADKRGAQTSNLYHLSPCTKIGQPPAQELGTPCTDIEQPLPKLQAPPCTDIGHKVSKVLTTQREVKDSPSQDEPTKRPDYSGEFAEWWSVYPHPLRDEKGRAQRNYTALRNKGTTHERLLTSARNYAATRRGEDAQYHKKAANFLGRDGAWTEWETSQPATRAPQAALPPEDDVTRMLRELRQGKEGGNRGAGIRRDAIAQHGDPRSEYEYTEQSPAVDVPEVQ